MSYGHAERNLAAIRQLTMDTIALLSAQDRLTVEEARWLGSVAYGRDYIGESDRKRRGRPGCPSPSKLAQAFDAAVESMYEQLSGSTFAG